MRDGGVDWKRDGRYLGGGPEPQVDALDIAVLSPLLQQLDDPPADPDGRFASIFARTTRHRRRIEQQQQVDVGRIVELAAAELAHGDYCETGGSCVGHAFGEGGGDGLVDSLVRKVRKKSRDPLERQLARKIPQRHG